MDRYERLAARVAAVQQAKGARTSALAPDLGLGFRVWGLGFRIQGLGFRIQGLGFRIQDLGFRV